MVRVCFFLSLSSPFSAVILMSGCCTLLLLFSFFYFPPPSDAPGAVTIQFSAASFASNTCDFDKHPFWICHELIRVCQWGVCQRSTEVFSGVFTMQEVWVCPCASLNERRWYCLAAVQYIHICFIFIFLLMLHINKVIPGRMCPLMSSDIFFRVETFARESHGLSLACTSQAN